MRREYAGRYYEAVALAKLEAQVAEPLSATYLSVIGTNPRCWMLEDPAALERAAAAFRAMAPRVDVVSTRR